MVDREIGVGIIGFGLGGRVFHAPFVSAVSGLRLAAIMQRTGDQAAKAFPAAEIARSFDALLANRAVELVVVTTPNATHFALAKQALEAGKHVVIESPSPRPARRRCSLANSPKAKGCWSFRFTTAAGTAIF